MSATAKKKSMRGGGTPSSPSGEIPAEDQEGGGLTPELLEEFDKQTEAEELDEEPQELEDLNPLDLLALPSHTEEDEQGDWIYTLQHEPRDKLSFSKVRIPKRIYAKDIRRSTQGRNDGETIFYMLCSVSNVPARLMDKIDARDYAVLSSLMQRRALGNSRAVLRSIGGGDSETE